jgi:uncharacterized membrane protein YhaH (DUF805 family)
MEWMILPFKRYFDFRGRSRRMEFWMFQLLNIIVTFALLAMFISGFPWSEIMEASQQPSESIAPEAALAMFGPLFWAGLGLWIVWSLAVFIPATAVSVRRLHDRDMSGWWYGGLLIASFIPIINMISWIGFLVLLVIFFLPGTEGPNRYGPDPKDPSQAQVFA